MDWKNIIAEIRQSGATLEQIANQCGFASRGHVHDVMTGKQGEPKWSIGDKLLSLHRKSIRQLRRRNG
jgi:lambda repressor-like predicted transcriptional regulator